MTGKSSIEERARDVFDSFRKSFRPPEEYPSFVAGQLVAMNGSGMKVNSAFLMKFAEESRQLFEEHYGEESARSYCHDKILASFDTETIPDFLAPGTHDLFLLFMAYFVKYFLTAKDICIGEAITGNESEDFSEVYRLMRKIANDNIVLTDKHNKPRQIHYIGHTASRLAGVLYGNDYPGSDWISCGETDHAALGTYDLYFLDRIPMKAVGIRKEFDEDTREEYDVEIRVPNFEKYGEILRDCVKLVKKPGYLVTSFSDALSSNGGSSLTPEQWEQIIKVWTDAGLFIRAIVRINAPLLFFILQHGGSKASSYTFLKYSPDDGKDMRKSMDFLMKRVHGMKPWASVVCNIDRSLSFTGDIELLLKKQTEREAEQKKLTQDFQKKKCNELIDTSLGVAGNVSGALYPLPDDPQRYLYVPRSVTVFDKVRVTFDLKEMYRKIAESGLPYDVLDFSRIKWYEACRKKYKPLYWGKWDEALHSTKLNTRWEDLNYGPWVMVSDISLEEEDVGGTDIKDEIDDPGYSIWSDEYGDYIKPTLLGYSDVLLIEDGVYFKERRNGDSVYVLCQKFKGQNEEFLTPFQRILAEVIQANVWAIPLDEEFGYWQYFQLYLQTPLGDKLMEEWGERSKNEDILRVFKDLDIFLPAQEEILKINSAYNQFRTNMNSAQTELKKNRQKADKLLDYIGGTRTVYQCPKPVKESRTSVGSRNIEFLPQSLSAVLYLDACEVTITRKIINLIHFMEALAIFNAVVLLSILRELDPGNANEIIRKTFSEDGKTPVSFGLWTKLASSIIGVAKEKEKTDISSGFPETARRIFEACADLTDCLHKCRVCRNNEYGHTGRKTEKDEKLLDGKLYDLSVDVADKFLDVYQNITFLHVGKDASNHEAEPFQEEKRFTGVASDSDENTLYQLLHYISSEAAEYFTRVYQKLKILHVTKCESNHRGNHVLYAKYFSGPNGRLRNFDLPAGSAVDISSSASGLHILMDEKLIPILPMIFVGQLSQKDANLLCTYYLSSIEISKDDKKWGIIGWNSFDCGDRVSLTYHYDSSFAPACQLIDMIHDAYKDDRNKK